MTNAPPDLLAVQRYARDKTGQGWASLGIIHSTPQGGGYHEGHDLLHAAGTAPEDPGSDYSYTESSRDRAGLTDAASAFDFGGEFKRFLEFNAWIVGRAKAEDPRCRDIREIIHTPDGRTVKRWDALGVRSSGDSSHLTHTHFSFFRDSLGRRDRDDNFLGLLKEFFDGGNDVSQQTDNIIKAWSVGMPKGAGGEVVAPVQWRIWDEKWQASVNAAFTALSQKVTDLAGKPSAQVALTAVDRQAIADSLKPLIPTAAQVADELAKRLGNG